MELLLHWSSFTAPQIWVCPCLNFNKRKHFLFFLRNLKLLFWEEVVEFHTSYLWISRINAGIRKHVHPVHRASRGDWVCARFWFSLVSVYQPGFRVRDCPGTPVLLVKVVPLVWCKTLELQHEGRLGQQEQELSGISGCLHSVFTALQPLKESPWLWQSIVCLLRCPVLGTAWIPGASQHLSRCRSFVRSGWAMVWLPRHTPFHLPSSWECTVHSCRQNGSQFCSSPQMGREWWAMGVSVSFYVWFYPQLDWQHLLCDWAAQPGGLGLFWKKWAQGPSGKEEDEEGAIGM